MSTAKTIARAERQLRVLAMRKDHGMSLRQIAAREGCGVETARRDINKHLAQLDAACLESAAAMRAELLEKYDALLQALEHEVLSNGNLDRVGDLLKTSAEIRRLYALDVQPLGRTELALRRAVITEIATKLRDQLPPETFAEVAVLLTNDEPIELLGDIACEAGDAPSTQPPRRQREGQGPTQSLGYPAPELVSDTSGVDRQPLPVVVTEHCS